MKEGGIVVINFGSQYVQLIARRVRELNVYSEILPWDTPVEEILKRKPKGVIFSGGPASVYAKDAPLPDPRIYETGLPILGICYGLQVLAHQLGGKVAPAEKHEYGRATLKVLKEDKLFKGLPKEFQVWMSHADKVVELPPGFEFSPKGGMDTKTPLKGKNRVFEKHPERIEKFFSSKRRKHSKIHPKGFLSFL